MSQGRLVYETAVHLREHGHEEESRRVAMQAAEWYREIPPEQLPDVHRKTGLARSLYLAEHWEESAAVWQELATSDPENVLYQGRLGTLAARRGDREEAHRISEKLGRLMRRDLRGENHYWRAHIAALLDEKAEAVRFLQTAFADGKYYSFAYPPDMDFDTLREYPPYVELIRPKG
jgi:Flp pilus assembly protein TadD